MNQRENLLVLGATILSFEVVVCGISWVCFKIGVVFENIGFEVFLDDPVQANPVEERQQIHFVQNRIEAEVNKEIQRIVDGDVPQANLILEEITLPDWILVIDYTHQVLVKNSFLDVVSFNIFFGHFLI